MEGMDAEGLELYELLKPKLDEEPAKRLVLALGPSRDQIATKSDLALLEARMVEKLTWRMITVMGAWTVVGTSLFAFMSRLFQP